jgi:Flp pilus assembly protein TadB
MDKTQAGKRLKVTAMNEHEQEQLNNWYQRRSLRKTIISTGLIAIVAVIMPFAGVTGILPYISVAFIIFLIWLAHFVLRFRIRKGYFGNNESEARELLEALAEEAKK